MKIKVHHVVPAKPAVPAKTKEVEKIICDFCEANLPKHGSYGFYPKCYLCKRDACRKHLTPDPDEWGDHPDWFCKICAELYFPARAELNQRHDKEQEELEARIQKESLAKE